MKGDFCLFFYKVSSNKNWRLSCFMMSGNYFGALSENLFEGSKVFHTLPNAENQSKHRRKHKQKGVK